MPNWLRPNSSDAWSWAASMAASVIIFAVSRGTEFQQFGVGILSASFGLLVLMATFEAIWQAGARSFDLLVNREANNKKCHHGSQ
jgi:hypothetical protein